MGQKSRAVYPDVSEGTWTPTPIYKFINEPAPDLVGVSSADGVSPDAFEVRLAALAWPKDRGDGTHVLTVRLKRTGADPADAALLLLQGAKVIAAKIAQPGTSYQDVTLSLTAAEVARIADYSDLRLRVIAGRVTTPCCPDPLPAILYVTFSSGTGTCACLNGLSLPVVWDATRVTWVSGPLTLCGQQGASLQVGCTPPGFGLQGSGLGGGGPITNCNPLLAVMNVLSSGGLCSGSVTATLTQ